MMKKFSWFLVMALVWAFIPVASFAQQEKSSGQAKETALRWLGNMDAGDYDACYYMLSSAYLDAIKTGNSENPKGYWITNMRAARSSLGANGSRQVFRMTPVSHLTSGRGSSKAGTYIIFDIKSSFSNNPSVVETVSTQYEGGAWKVSSYIFN